MKKKFVIFMLVCICLFIGTGLYLLSNAQKLANKFKPQLEKAIGNALQRSATLGDLSIELFPALKLAVATVTLKNSPQSTEGLLLKNVAFSLQLLPLLSGSLVVDRLIVDQPQVKVIKTEELTYIEGLKPLAQAKSNDQPHKNRQAEQNNASSNKQNKSEVSNSLMFDLRDLQVNSGQLTFEDQTKNKTIVLNDLDILSKLILNEQKLNLKDVTFSAKLADDLPIMLATNDITYYLSSGAVSIPSSKLTALGGEITQAIELEIPTQNGSVRIETKSFPLNQLSELLHALELSSDNLQLSGNISSNSEIKLAGADNISLAGESTLDQVDLLLPTLSITNLASKIQHTYSDSGATATSTGTTLKLNSADFQVDWTIQNQGNTVKASPIVIKGLGGEGTLNAEARLDGVKPFSALLVFNNIAIAKAVAVFAPNLPLKVDGTIQRVSAQVSGTQSPSPLKSLSGAGDLKLAPAVIKNINIAGEALQAVTNLPFLADALLSKVPENLRGAFTSPDSLIDQADLQWTIKNSVITVSKLNLSAQLYQITGSGTISLEQQLDFKTELILNSELSQSMINSTKELKYLADDSGQIRLPVSIKGHASKPTITPQLDKILKNAATGTVKEKLAEGLDQILGGNKEQGKNLGKIFGF